MAAVWSSGADDTSSHPRLQGQGEHQEGEGVPVGTMAKLPRAMGMAPASFHVHFPFLALWRGLSTVPQTPSEAPFPKPLPKHQQPDRLCLSFAAIFSLEQKEKWQAQEGWEIQIKAFLMKASAVAIKDMDLINGSYSQITLRLFSFSQRGASTHRVSLLFSLLMSSESAVVTVDRKASIPPFPCYQEKEKLKVTTCFHFQDCKLQLPVLSVKCTNPYNDIWTESKMDRGLRVFVCYF